MFKSKCINIVGAGISGAVIARSLAEKGYSVYVEDFRDTIGGNCYDFVGSNGICVQKYGAHIFHTDNETVWKFLSRFTSWIPYEHRVEANVFGKFIQVPFNFNSIETVFDSSESKEIEETLLSEFKEGTKVPILELSKNPNPLIKRLAEYVYENVFSKYTAKQWGCSPEEIDKSVTARVPVLIGRDPRYFQDKYQAIPLNGYSSMIYNMLNHPNITVELERKHEKNIERQFAEVIYTGAIDEYFDYCFGMLPYRSLRFTFETFDNPQYQHLPVVNYTVSKDFTRKIEFKHFRKDQSDKTVVATEYPAEFKNGENERYYPVLNENSKALYQKYLEHSKQFEHLHFLGRLGDFKYYDMDDAVLNALRLSNLF